MLKWLLFDLNSFFASCEQQEDPLLRGRPVAVIPSMTDTTSVIAASYEAKRFGIKTNTRVGDAKRMCPNLILKVGNHRLYTEYHHRILAAIEEVLPIKKVLSIDEVACELIGKERDEATARKIAQQMKDHVRAKVGSEIKSSVGIGPNILIAKIASDMMKPDGLVIVDKHEIRSKIGPLPIEDLPGVGRRMKPKLNAQGYFKISDFIDAPEQRLRKHWGSIWGLRVARELSGEDIAYNKNPEQASLSHQHVLPPALRENAKAYDIAFKLLMKAASRLRDDKMQCERLSVYVKSTQSERFENTVHFSGSSDSYFLTQQLQKLWNLPPQFKPMKVAVVLSSLTSGPTQMSLFDNPRKEVLNQALDSVNTRFGPNTLFMASTKSVLNSAKTRISFNHVPKLSDELEEASD